MHHKNEVSKIMNDLVKGQGLDIGPEIKRVHEIMDSYRDVNKGSAKILIRNLRKNSGFKFGF